MNLLLQRLQARNNRVSNNDPPCQSDSSPSFDEQHDQVVQEHTAGFAEMQRTGYLDFPKENSPQNNCENYTISSAIGEDNYQTGSAEYGTLEYQSSSRDIAASKVRRKGMISEPLIFGSSTRRGNQVIATTHPLRWLRRYPWWIR